MFLAQHECSRARRAVLKAMLSRACDTFGRDELEGLQPGQIAMWRATMPPPTRWQATQAIAQVAAWAVRWELASRNPFANIRNPRPRAREFAIFESWQAIERLSAQLPDGLRLLPCIGAGCGLRPGELLGLQWRDIDLVARRLVVRRRVVDGRVQAGGKTRASVRSVPIRDRVGRALLSVRTGVQDDGLVFVSRFGGPLDLRNLRRRAWRPALERAGLDPAMRLYDLRHTYAAWSLRAGVPAYQLSRRMGTSLAMIDATYGHLVADADGHERALLDAWDSESAVTATRQDTRGS